MYICNIFEDVPADLDASNKLSGVSPQWGNGVYKTFLRRVGLLKGVTIRI